MKTKIALIRPGIHQTDIDFSIVLQNAGYEVYLLIPEYSTTDNSKTGFKLIKYKTFNKNFLKSYPVPLKLGRILKEINPDIIQPNEDFQIYSWICANYSKKHGKRLILISEKYTYPNLLNKIIIKLIDFFGFSKKVWKESKSIISHGSETTKFIVERGALAKKIVNLPIGVNTLSFPKKENYIVKKEINLITVARFIPHKALDILVRAVKDLENVTLTIIGIGPLETEIRDLMSNLGISNRVNVIPSIEHSNLYKIFHKSDIYICSSRREIASTTIPEAMSVGLPIICTDAGSSKDFIKEGINGFLFESENIEDLKDKIKKFINNAELIKKMGKNSAKITRERLDWKTLIKKYVNIIKK